MLNKLITEYNEYYSFVKCPDGHFYRNIKDVISEGMNVYEVSFFLNEKDEYFINISFSNDFEENEGTLLDSFMDAIGIIIFEKKLITLGNYEEDTLYWENSSNHIIGNYYE